MRMLLMNVLITSVMLKSRVTSVWCAQHTFLFLVLQLVCITYLVCEKRKKSNMFLFRHQTHCVLEGWGLVQIACWGRYNRRVVHCHHGSIITVLTWLYPKEKTISSPLLSLSSRTNILLVHSSAVSWFGWLREAATLILYTACELKELAFCHQRVQMLQRERRLPWI